MGWLLVVTVLVSCALAAACWRLSLQRRLLVRENERWRNLARERADQGPMLSHELRTPLALISGSAELLADLTAGELEPLQAELVSGIRVNAARMQTLTDDLLAEARIDAGLFRMRMVQVNLRRLALQVVRDLRRLEGRTIRFECRGAPPWVPGDPDLLRQVLVNLVTNALRHAGEGAEVAVRLRRSEDCVLVSVSDSGEGMDPRARTELYRRTLEGTSENGNGLGMLISKKIVDMHGGRMMVDSVTRRGTTVTVALPDAAPRPLITRPAPVGRQTVAPGELGSGRQ